MTNILEEIVAHKKMEIAALDVSALRRAGESVPAPRDFLAALSRRRNSPFLIGDGTGVRLSLIAELKRASPSKGILLLTSTYLKWPTFMPKMALLQSAY